MCKKHYKHLFFDLDKTLWDFKTNSYETLKEIYTKYFQSVSDNISIENFLKSYEFHNNLLWDAYRNRKISKEVLRIDRFILTLKDFKIQNNDLANKMAEEYVKLSPFKTNLFPYAIETLEYLNKSYKLHIITNGFKEVQYPKLKHTGLNNFFTEVIISEETGYMKPDKKIFLYSLNKANAVAEESLMIGDDFDVDIVGAQAIGMDQVLFSPDNTFKSDNVTFKISSLLELKDIL